VYATVRKTKWLYIGKESKLVQGRARAEPSVYVTVDHDEKPRDSLESLLISVFFLLLTMTARRVSINVGRRRKGENSGSACATKNSFIRRFSRSPGIESTKNTEKV
jgi:hypothetical protein